MAKKRVRTNGYLFLDTGVGADKDWIVPVCQADMFRLRRELPKLKLWQRVPECQLEIGLSRAEATELLQVLKIHLRDAEWDRDPYGCTCDGPSTPMFWHRLFSDRLVPYLEGRLAA